MVVLFLSIGAIFGLLAAATAYLITYEEWSHHTPDRSVVVRRSLHMAVVAFVFLVACSVVGGWLFTLLGGSP